MISAAIIKLVHVRERLMWISRTCQHFAPKMTKVGVVKLKRGPLGVPHTARCKCGFCGKDYGR